MTVKYFVLSLFSLFRFFTLLRALRSKCSFILSVFVCCFVLFCSLEKSESTISKLQEQLKKEKGEDVIPLEFVSGYVRFCRQHRSENRKDKAGGDHRKARRTIFFLQHCSIFSLQSNTKT